MMINSPRNGFAVLPKTSILESITIKMSLSRLVRDLLASGTSAHIIITYAAAALSLLCIGLGETEERFEGLMGRLRDDIVRKELEELEEQLSRMRMDVGVLQADVSFIFYCSLFRKGGMKGRRRKVGVGG